MRHSKRFFSYVILTLIRLVEFYIRLKIIKSEYSSVYIEGSQVKLFKKY